MSDVTCVPLRAARSAIARALAHESDSIPTRLGGVTLRPHQRASAKRLAALITQHGGAMLAEPVGLGKTYIALAVAARLGERLLIAAPASLREMWRGALAECGMSATVITHESLSRGTAPAFEPGFVIVDEAHRLRSPGTRRYGVLAEACRRSKLLLVTATPVHNRRADLAAQLALFLGRVAWEMSDEQLAQHVVRDAGEEPRGQPRLVGPHRVSLPDDDDCLDALLALPPPVPAKDEALAVALLSYGLVHQWMSSRAALIASLDRRRARGIALMSAVDAGRRPTRAEMTAWTHTDSVVQLAFPELVTADAPVEDASLDALMLSLRRHDLAVASLLATLREGNDSDVHRANALRQIRADHPGERIIAFCQYTETVRVLRSLLARDAGVAALTARGARIAGGKISRDDAIRQFIPRTDNSRSEKPSERIDLLITTDLLSEGLNLQEASVIVHLDLPWNPARLDQRVGRARRLGSRHDAVTVYTIAPPASAERMLQIEARLREKLSVAQHTVGIAGHILPSLLGAELDRQGLAERIGAVHTTLQQWLEPAGDSFAPGLIVSAARSSLRGFLAVVRDADGAHLVADVGSGIERGLAAIQRAVNECGDNIEAPVDSGRLAEVRRQLHTWLIGQRAAATIDFQAATAARSRRAALTRVAQAVARAPRHQRSRLAPLAAAARAVATAPMAEGAERILELLVQSQLPDEAWLRSIAAFAELNTRPGNNACGGHQAPSILVLILLEPV